ncbi:extracellular solute-binding protein [Tessaracoccus terricola]
MSVNPKRIVSLVGLLSAAALGLTACGGTTTPETTADSTADAGETTAAETTGAEETAGSGEVVELEYIHRLPDGEGMTLVADIAARWNAENPNIQVSTTKFDGQAQDLIVKLETDIKANNAACLAQVGYAEVPELFVKGMLEDVTEIAAQYEGNFGGAFGQMSVGGVTVGLPQDSGPLIYIYNEAAFAELGIEVPTNLDEFTSAAATAAAAGKYIASFTPDEAQYWLSAQAASAGAIWFSAENDQWAVNADSPESAVVADFWQNLLDNGSVATYDRWAESFNKALVDGELVGHIAAAWEVGFVLDPLDGTDAEGQWRVAQLPDFGAGEVTGPDGGSGVAVMKGCEHPAEAMEFNNWFNTQVDDLASQGLVPTALEQAENPEKWTRQFGGQDVMAELVEANSRLNADFNYIPGFSTLGPVMSGKAAEVVAGSAKVADIFTAAQETAVATLKDAGLPVAEG